MPARASSSSEAPPGAATPAAIGFRPLAHADLRRLCAWLNDPAVARWYSHDRARTIEDVENKYGPRISGESPTRVYVVMLDGADAGIAQTYAIADYPDFAAALGAGPDWAGLDYLLGEPTFRGRRLAHRVIEAFVRDVVFAERRTRICAAVPAAANVKSIRALARAGFTHERDVELESGSRDCLMLALRR